MFVILLKILIFFRDFSTLLFLIYEKIFVYEVTENIKFEKIN